MLKYENRFDDDVLVIKTYINSVIINKSSFTVINHVLTDFLTHEGEPRTYVHNWAAKIFTGKRKRRKGKFFFQKFLLLLATP